MSKGTLQFIASALELKVPGKIAPHSNNTSTSNNGKTVQLQPGLIIWHFKGVKSRFKCPAGEQHSLHWIFIIIISFFFTLNIITSITAQAFSSTPTLKMPDFPLEVWSNIASNFQLPPLDLGHHAPSSTFLARRACLRSLCLTSHKLAAAAQPWLYRSIILYSDPDGPSTDPHSLVQLLRTLATSPSLQVYIQHFACALKLWPNEREREGGCNEDRIAVLHEWQAMRDVFEDLPPAEKRFFVQAALLGPSSQVPAPQIWPYARHLDTGIANAIKDWTSGSQTPQRLLAILLCFTPRLQSLLLQGSPVEDSPMRPFSDLLQYFLIQDSVDQSPILPLLSTIRLQPDRTNTMREPWTGAQICQDFLEHLPSLRRLDLWKSRWVRGTDYLPDPKWANKLEDINVALSAPLGDIACFVEQATALRTLRIDCMALPSAFSVQRTQRDLNNALQRHAATLERLRLTGMPDAFQRQGTSLWCLPQLPHVEHLEIEYQQLIRPQGIAGEVRVPDMLPPNLRSLKLLFLQEGDFDTFMLMFPLDLEFARGQKRLRRLDKIHLEVFSAAKKDDLRQRAAIDARVVAIIEQGCVCTYTLNFFRRDPAIVRPWALDGIW
ncbi:hypothetical protein PG993_007782 [Apiospora rasikravindrae]|uniref:F-box domain-containing protein n=1 Tax=Apiospora rasikravindrae TaxID=990691 RepID=A0ABR1SYH7_9PEZI